MMRDILELFDAATEKTGHVRFYNPDDISIAQENDVIYDRFNLREDDDLSLFKSVGQHGVLEPLQISRDRVLLSGHRRLRAAQLADLEEVPAIQCDVVFESLNHEERIKILALYNESQRDKNYGEKFREALAQTDADVAYNSLIKDRVSRIRQGNDDQCSVVLGDKKRRARITTRQFLKAAQDVIDSERDYWPLTVRRVHYLMLNDPPLRHDKKPASRYGNDLVSYKSLTNLLIRARLSGEIPIESIEDATRPVHTLRTYQGTEQFFKDELDMFLRYYTRDLQRGQANHIEVLLEKNGMRRYVEKVCDEYCVTCTTGVGYSSLTPRLKMKKRFVLSQKSTLVLLILTDFDPDGEAIASSFPRSLRDDLGVKNIVPVKVGLLADDIIRYNLPSDLRAKSSSSNYKKFVAKHGVRVAELDACPLNILQDKLRLAIESFMDAETFHHEMAAERSDAAYISTVKTVTKEALENILSKKGADNE